MGRRRWEGRLRDWSVCCKKGLELELAEWRQTLSRRRFTSMIAMTSVGAMIGETMALLLFTAFESAARVPLLFAFY